MTCMREKSTGEIQRAALELNAMMAGLEYDKILTMMLDPYQAVKDHRIVRTDPFNVFCQPK